MIEVVVSLIDFSTALACLDSAHLPSEHALNEVLLGRVSKHPLKPIEDQAHKLLSILLNAHIGWVATVVFVREAEFSRVILLSLREF